MGSWLGEPAWDFESAVWGGARSPAELAAMASGLDAGEATAREAVIALLEETLDGGSAGFV